jgi:hypothetical protein
MPGFSAEWLALREPADTRARSQALVQRLASHWRSRQPIRALDLGSGTGANVRFLRGHLQHPCEWVLADHDAGLLARAHRLLEPGITVRAIELTNLDALAQVVSGRDFVTASALLDLVSQAWLGALVKMCAATRAAVLFALSYDGRMTCEPREAEDEIVRDLVNAHQQTNKGFGAALGPGATAAAEATLQANGYRVWREPSDWVLTAESELQMELIKGWTAAAIELAPDREMLLASWRERRLAHVAAGRSRLVVGHEDLAAIPRR